MRYSGMRSLPSDDFSCIGPSANLARQSTPEATNIWSSLSIVAVSATPSSSGSKLRPVGTCRFPEISVKQYEGMTGIVSDPMRPTFEALSQLSHCKQKRVPVWGCTEEILTFVA